MLFSFCSLSVSLLVGMWSMSLAAEAAAVHVIACGRVKTESRNKSIHAWRCVCVCVCHMRFVRRYNNHWKRLQLRSDVIEKMLWFSLLPSIELNAVLLILLIHNHKLSPGSETVSIRYVWRAERNSYGFHIYGLLISTNNDDTYCVFRNATHQLNILNSGNIGLQQQSKEKGTPMRTPHGSAFFSLAFVYAMNSKFI